MKRFITSVLFVSVFFIGLGTLVQKAGARFRSDEKAIALIKAARAAIGGESAISSVRSMSIAGKTTHTMRFNGTERIEQGDTEIAFQLPDKFSKMVKLGNADGSESKQLLRSKEVVIVDDAQEGVKVPAPAEGPGVQRVIVRKGGDATSEDSGEIRVFVRKGEGENGAVTVTEGQPEGNRVMLRKSPAGHESMRHNDMLSTTLGLLLTTPEGMDANYTYAGESSVDGTPCNVVQVQAAGSVFKLFLNADSNLPVMISYVSNELPHIIRLEKKQPEAGGDDQLPNKVTFEAKADAPESAEVQVKFSDYRSVAGIQLPFRWTRTVNGNPLETFEVTNYDVNPANIAEKLQQPKVFFKTMKEGQN